MLHTVLARLTDDQKRALKEAGVSGPLLSMWKSGVRLPTEVQTIILADVADVDHHQLQDEIALMRATPEQRKIVERVLGKIARGVVATLVCGLLGAALTAQAPGSRLSLAGSFRRR